MDRAATSRTIAHHIQSDTHHSVSARTIRRRLQQSGMFVMGGQGRLFTRPQNFKVSFFGILTGRRSLLRLLLTRNHRRLCHQWCDERWIWATQSNDIVFTDESRFYLQQHDDQIDGKTMGGIGFHCRIPLVRIAGTLNIQRNVSEVLKPVFLPYIQRLPSAILQEGNARPHVARYVQEFFFKRQIKLLPWPTCSLDLSPVENE
ncbi:transposable element Tcb1 transposase [Trichonephila clavipes]|nr:transposable element Tcb1 transposase [Trichonephila clavipes]